MEALGKPVFRPQDFRRGFSRETIVEHLKAVCEMVDEIDPPADLRVAVFGVVQAMESAMQPLETGLAVPTPKMAIPTSR